MAEGIIKITHENDPERCQAVTKNGQCPNKAVKNGTTCRVHGGNSTEIAQKSKELRNYRLQLYKERLTELGASEHIKSLRDEVAILRLLLENKFNLIKDESDLLIDSGPIAKIVLDVERVVTACHKLEDKTGQLLDKQEILQVADTIVSIIREEIQDDEVLTIIMDRINDIFRTDKG